MQSFAKRQRAQSALAIVGVDAGKFHHALIVRPRGGRDSRPITLPTSRAGFDDAVERIMSITQLAHPSAAPADLLIGIEFAGSYGFTFAHYLHHRGFEIVTVLPSDTKRWKEVMHHQALKTDQKDALGITDLVSRGHFVRFAFLEPVYAELRYLVSTRERFSLQRRAAITRLKATLELVFPECQRSCETPQVAIVSNSPPPPRELGDGTQTGVGDVGGRRTKFRAALARSRRDGDGDGGRADRAGAGARTGGLGRGPRVRD